MSAAHSIGKDVKYERRVPHVSRFSRHRVFRHAADARIFNLSSPARRSSKAARSLLISYSLRGGPFFRAAPYPRQTRAGEGENQCGTARQVQLEAGDEEGARDESS
jgi:hypothetical protein